MKEKSWWNDVPGSVNTSLLLEDIEDELKLLLVNHLCKACDVSKLDPEDEMEEVEFVIEFTSTGYEDSGRISGPPENCYPPSGEDERIMSSITFITKNYEMKLEEDTANKVFEKFFEDVESADLEDI